MDAKTQQKAINGAIALWEDIYFVQGKGFMARRLKPYIQASLKEPCSAIHRLFEATPGRAEWYIQYSMKPKGWRRKIIGQNLTRKAVQELTWLFKRGIYNLAIAYLSEGITAAEAERRINQQYEDALSTITLKELVKVDDSVTYKNEIRNLMARLGLSTGSIAGADKRLSAVLSQRFRTLTGSTRLYEQDLKAAIWECARGNHHMQYETLKMIEGDPPRPLEEQIALIVRIFRGQEQKLMRDTLLRITRKTIANLPDIRQDIKNAERQCVEFPLDDEKLDSLPAKPEQYENALDNFLDMMTERGVEISRLDTRDLELLSDELSRLRNGMTRKQHYGDRENQRKQQLKYLSKRLKAKA